MVRPAATCRARPAGQARCRPPRYRARRAAAAGRCRGSAVPSAGTAAAPAAHDAQQQLAHRGSSGNRSSPPSASFATQRMTKMPTTRTSVATAGAPERQASWSGARRLQQRLDGFIHAGLVAPQGLDQAASSSPHADDAHAGFDSAIRKKPMPSHGTMSIVGEAAPWRRPIPTAGSRRSDPRHHHPRRPGIRFDHEPACHRRFHHRLTLDGKSVTNSGFARRPRHRQTQPPCRAAPARSPRRLVGQRASKYRTRWSR